VRVGLVCPYPWDVPGGVAAHTRDLALSLRELGHQVEVLSPVLDSDAPREPWVTDAGRPVGFPYNGSRAWGLLGPVSYTRVRRWVVGGRFGVLHLQEPLAWSVSLIACYVANGPLVATFHSATARSRLLHATAEPLFVPALEKVRARIVVSPAARRTLVEHLGGDAVEIPNGVRGAALAAARPMPRYDGVPLVVFLGRVDEPRKGLATLIGAWSAVRAAVPGARLAVAGPGDAAEVLAPLGPADRACVDVLGQVSEEDKGRLLRSATVYCAPNLGGESFGIVLLEAAAAGAPVVASDLEAFRLVLGGSGSGVLVPVGDERTLADALVGVLRDPVRRAALVAAGRAVAARYDWSVIATRVVDVYETVAPRREVVGIDPDGVADLGPEAELGPLG